MATVNITKNNLDSTVKIFDTFYNSELVINVNDFERVRAFFKAHSDDIAIADQFTASFFQIQANYNISVEDLLTKFETVGDPLSVDQTIAYYLNGLRSKSTLVGVSVLQSPNQYAARNVSK